jgi:hypothetical protein
LAPVNGTFPEVAAICPGFGLVLYLFSYNYVLIYQQLKQHKDNFLKLFKENWKY